jgi:hypothetical protein
MDRRSAHGDRDAVLAASVGDVAEEWLAPTTFSSRMASKAQSRAPGVQAVFDVRLH